MSDPVKKPPVPALQDLPVLEPTWTVIAKAVLLGIAITALAWVAVRAMLAVPVIRAYFFD